MVNAGVGLSELEAPSTGASNPSYNCPSNFLPEYNAMNTVSIQTTPRRRLGIIN